MKFSESYRYSVNNLNQVRSEYLKVIKKQNCENFDLMRAVTLLQALAELRLSRLKETPKDQLQKKILDSGVNFYAGFVGLKRNEFRKILKDLGIKYRPALGNFTFKPTTGQTVYTADVWCAIK